MTTKTKLEEVQSAIKAKKEEVEDFTEQRYYQRLFMERRFQLLADKKKIIQEWLEDKYETVSYDLRQSDVAGLESFQTLNNLVASHQMELDDLYQKGYRRLDDANEEMEVSYSRKLYQLEDELLKLEAQRGPALEEDIRAKREGA